MKYVIVIPDGCADEPQESLGGKTPLQAAHKPNMDRIAQQGVVGRANNVPRPLTPASDVATLEPVRLRSARRLHGPAPLETAAMGIPLGPDDWAIRCNLVHVENECMRDFTAGHITSEEGRPLIEALQAELGVRPSSNFTPASAIATFSFTAPRRYDAPFSDQTKTQPPHDVPDRPIAEHLPKGPGSDLLRSLMEQQPGDPARSSR